MKRHYFPLFIILVCLNSLSIAQNRLVDSLRNVLKTEQDDTNKIKTLIKLSSELERKEKYDTAITCASSIITLAEKLASSPSSAVVKASKKVMAKAYNNIGIMYDEQGNYPQSLEYYFNALKTYEELGNKDRQADVMGNIGIVYKEQNDAPMALKYYFSALKIKEELGDKEGQARANGNIGNVYYYQGDSAKALKYFIKSLKMNEEVGYENGQAINMGNIGNIYKDRRDYPKALEYYLKSLKMAEDLGNEQLQANNAGNIGEIYIKTGKFKESEEYLKKTIVLDSTIGYRNELIVCEELISQLYDTTGRSKLALIWYKKAMILKDTLFNIDKNKALTRKEITYEFEKKEDIAKAEQERKDLQVEEDKKKQRIITWSIAAGLMLVLVFAGLIFRSLNVTRRQKDLIGKQKAEVEKQKQIVEEKNKDILDSITYAKRLQDAILPPLGLVKQCLPQSFLFYKPKDIVAGDFYWMEQVGDNILVAAADCTGHGVPGAMVSMVCSNALNRTVKEFKITEPGKILDKVRELVLETFEKSEDNVQDGMDISLCCINTKTNEVQWSGAYNSLWYVRNEQIIEVPADKQPIGKADKPMPFNTHNIKLQKGDTIYLLTDGYADQFGGPKGKKFKFKPMQELLLANSGKPMDTQKEVLESTLERWKGDLEQVDDVLVIGIRI